MVNLNRKFESLSRNWERYMSVNDRKIFNKTLKDQYLNDKHGEEACTIKNNKHSIVTLTKLREALNSKS